VPIVGAVLLLTVHRNLGAVHVQYDGRWRFNGFPLAIDSQLIAASPSRFSFWVNKSASKDCGGKSAPPCGNTEARYVNLGEIGT
jgi:hypothetical protein